jgi:hypothetical protein
LPTITGVCTPACLLAASISVEAVTPPLVGLAIQRTDSRLGANPIEVNCLMCFDWERLITLLDHLGVREGDRDGKRTGIAVR